MGVVHRSVSVDASVRELPPTALETDEQLVSQVAVVDAAPFYYVGLHFVCPSLLGKNKKDEIYLISSVTLNILIFVITLFYFLEKVF